MVGTPDNPGIMVRALNELFQEMDKDEDVIYKVQNHEAVNYKVESTIKTKASKPFLVG